MSDVYGQEFLQWGIQFVVVFFLVAGCALLAVGASLIINSAGALRFFAAMNRWVSMRRFIRPAEVPRDIRQTVLKHRRWLAVAFIAGGGYALYRLVATFNTREIISVLGLDLLHPVFVAWLLESVRWILIAGNVAAVAVGVMLALFPDALIALEARGSRWFSQRRLAKGGDTMNLALDQLVAEFPRASGIIIVVFALVLIGVFGLMLPAI